MSLVSIIRDKSTKNNTNIPRDICGVIAKYSPIQQDNNVFIVSVIETDGGQLFQYKSLKVLYNIKDSIIYALKYVINEPKFTMSYEIFIEWKVYHDSFFYIQYVTSPYGCTAVVKINIQSKCDKGVNYEKEILQLQNDKDIKELIGILKSF